MLFLIFVLIIILNTVHCDTTEPPVDNLQPGRRDYVWTVDTLNIPFNVLESIWGFSPSDIWVIGKGGDLAKTIYHFNGSAWKTDGISRNVNPRTIWGFSANDIWIGGANTFWHYDGNYWKEHTYFTIPGYTYCGIEDVWGDNPNNIYAVGYAENNEGFSGLVMHYDGTNWTQSNFPMLERYNFDRIRKGENTNYYILGIRVEQFGEDTLKIFELVSNSLNEIYKGYTYVDSGGSFEQIGKEIFFLNNRKIGTYSSNQFHQVVKISELNFGGAFWGRNEKDIFLRMYDGIAHYNGTDIKYLYSFRQGISISDAMLFEKDVFFLAYDFNNGLNLTIRGKIN